MNRCPKHSCCSHLKVTVAAWAGDTSFCIRVVHIPCVIFHPAGSKVPKLTTVPHRLGEISLKHSLKQQCQRTCGLIGPSQPFSPAFSLRKRLLGNANTSSSDIFLSKVNYCVPGRHGFNFKTGSVTPLHQNAGFGLKVKLRCLRFFLRTVIPPNEWKYACCQTNFQKSFFHLVHRTCA